MSDNFLSQEEIDALLKQKDEGQDGEKNKENKDREKEEEKSEVKSEEESKKPEEAEDTAEQETSGELQDLSQEEKDALGEIGNISMGSAATTLSDILGKKVRITTPTINLSTQHELFDSFEKPYVVIDVNFSEGLFGSNLFLLKTSDASIIADLMMGGDGSESTEELNELQFSAVTEAMNQMMGSAATSMSNLLEMSVKISPPEVTAVDFDKEDYNSSIENEAVIIVSFNLQVGDLVDSQLMQVMPLEVARQKARNLLGPFSLSKSDDGEDEDSAKSESEEDVAEAEELEKEGEKGEEEEKSEPGEAEEDAGEEDFEDLGEKEVVYETKKTVKAEEPRNLDLILDVPLNVSVVLGKSRKPISDVLNLGPGTIVELDSLANEPVDILVNGTLIAQGEVVVVNENFGVQIKNIISPEERITKLRE